MTESRKTGPDATPAFSKAKKQTIPAGVAGGQDGEACSPWPAPGRAWGKYLIEKPLGRGGQAMVFQAFDQFGPAGHVALKVPRHPVPPEQVRAWIAADVEPLAEVGHPNVARIVDAGCIDGIPYVATRLVSGLPLAGYVKTHPPTFPRTLDWMIQLTDAVAWAHDRGTRHRDLNPDNIMISADGKPLIIDFGIAALVSACRPEPEAGSSGTPSYLAPEQARGDPTADHRVDIFALGGVLKFLLTGEGPYGPKDGATECCREAGAGHVQRLDTKSGPAIRRALARIANRAVAPDPGQRYPNAGQMAQALRNVGERRWVADAIALGLIVLAVGATVAAAFARRGGPPPVAGTTQPEGPPVKTEEDRRKEVDALNQAAGQACEAARAAGADTLLPLLWATAYGQYDDGLSAMKDRRYGQAAEAFGEARKAFVQLKQQGQEAATGASRRAEEARRAAREAGADKLFPSLWQQACRQADKGASEMSESRWALATEAFESAAKAFLDLKGQGQEAATAARQRAEEVRRAAREAGADKLFPSLWRQACGQADKGASEMSQGRWALATEAFESAAKAFLDLKDQAERQITTLRQRAEEVRRLCQNARELAEKAEAKQRAGDLWADAVKADEQANKAFQVGGDENCHAAAMTWKAAQAGFDRAREAAIAGLLDAENKRLAEMRATGQAVKAKDLAPDAWMTAERLYEKLSAAPPGSGDAKALRAAFDEAGEAYQQAAMSAVRSVMNDHAGRAAKIKADPPSLSDYGRYAEQEMVSADTAADKAAAAYARKQLPDAYREYVAAIRNLEEADRKVEAARSDAEARSALQQGRALLEEGSHEKALESVSQALKRQPGFSAPADREEAVRLAGELREHLLQYADPVVLGEHGKWVIGVAVSPDGQNVASTCGDPLLRIWAFEKPGLPVRTLKHEGPVWFAAYSCDGTVTTGGGKPRCDVWTWTAAGEKSTRFTGHTEVVAAVALAPDGKTLATGSWDKTVRLWEASGKPIRTLTGHTDIVNWVAFSPDGNQLVSAGNDNTIRLWTVQSGQGRVLGKHDALSLVSAVAFCPDGRHVASCGTDRKVRIWDLQRDEPLVSALTLPEPPASCVAFSPTGKRLACVSGTTRPLIRIWDWQRGKQLQELRGPAELVPCLVFSPDGKKIVASSRDGKVYFWPAAQ